MRATVSKDGSKFGACGHPSRHSALLAEFRRMTPVFAALHLLERARDVVADVRGCFRRIPDGVDRRVEARTVLFDALARRLSRLAFGEREGVRAERRQFFGETDESVAKKTKAALAAGLIPIVCVGETLTARESGQTHQVCMGQFLGGLGALTPEEFSRMLIAYEPIWAIGTGRTATPEMAADVHRFLRHCAAAKFSPAQASDLRILYGGSVKPDNIRGLMAQEELDGVLVGGASLDAKSFATIVEASR